MIYYEVKNKKDNKIIVSNMVGFKYSKYFLNNKNTKISTINTVSRIKESDDFIVWVVSVGDKDLFNSAKRFSLIVDTYYELSIKFFDYFLSKMNAHSHTITTIQGQMTTKLEGIIARKQFRSNAYNESIEKIKKIISGKEDELSEILFYLDKRLFDMRNQMDGFNLLYTNTTISLGKEDIVNIKKVLLSIATPFLDQLRENGVRLNIDSVTDDYAEANKVIINYKFFNLALYNFFDNIVKYTKENSEIKINFDKNGNNFSIFFEMISRHIEKHEYDLIFEDGYSGKHAVGKSGNGIGMFYTKKALNLTSLDIQVDRVVADYISDGNRYSTNTFKIFNII